MRRSCADASWRLLRLLLNIVAAGDVKKSLLNRKLKYDDKRMLEKESSLDSFCLG